MVWWWYTSKFFHLSSCHSKPLWFAFIWYFKELWAFLDELWFLIYITSVYICDIYSFHKKSRSWKKPHTPLEMCFDLESIIHRSLCCIIHSKMKFRLFNGVGRFMTVDNMFVESLSCVWVPWFRPASLLMLSISFYLFRVLCVSGPQSVASFVMDAVTQHCRS